MAIAIRGGSPATATYDGSGASFTATTVSAQVGDLLLIIHANDYYTQSVIQTPSVSPGAPSVSTVPGGTADGGSNLAHIAAFTAVVSSAGAQTVTATESGAHSEERSLSVYVLTGADTASPIDGSAAGTSGSASLNQTALSVSPSAADSYLVCAVATGGGTDSNAYTPPTGMTETYDLHLGGFYGTGGAVQQLSSSGATGTRTFVASNSAPWSALSIAVKTASGATTINGVAAGTAAAAATGTVIQAATGSATAAGTATAPATQRALATSVAAASASATGGVIVPGVATASAAGTASAVVTQAATATSGGIATATAPVVQRATGSAVAVATTTATGSAPGSTLNGTATVTAAGIATATVVQRAVATATAVASATGVTTVGATAYVVGVAAAQADSTVPVSGAASVTATSTGTAKVTQSAIGQAVGSAAATGAAVVSATATATGVSTATGVGGSPYAPMTDLGGGTTVVTDLDMTDGVVGAVAGGSAVATGGMA